MKYSKRWAIALAPLLLATLVACEDTIIKVIGPENDEAVSTTDGVFRYQSWNLDNVHDRRIYTWNNPYPYAMVKHRNFVHHGTVLLTVRDSRGALVDSLPVEWELDEPTSAGRPGIWTIQFEYFGARGRVDTSLEPLQELPATSSGKGQ
jgi:hypothetical protein